jgi:putative membrane protein
MSTLLVAFVALEHVGFFILESVLWKKPVGRKIFRMNAEKAEQTAVLAFNQGFYNLFLAAGLLFGLIRGDVAVTQFFLGCVLVAGVVGGMTASAGIFVVQALPGAIALGAVLAGK